MGETDDFQPVYMLIAVCATRVLDSPEATGDLVGCTGTPIMIHVPI